MIPIETMTGNKTISFIQLYDLLKAQASYIYNKTDEENMIIKRSIILHRCLANTTWMSQLNLASRTATPAAVVVFILMVGVGQKNRLTTTNI